MTTIQKLEEDTKKDGKSPEDYRLINSINLEALKELPWFLGDVDRKLAESLLQKSTSDTFLCRTSSQPGKKTLTPSSHFLILGHFALSLFTIENNSVLHVLIKPLDYGQRYYQLDGDPHIYPSIQSLVTQSSELSKVLFSFQQKFLSIF